MQNSSSKSRSSVKTLIQDAQKLVEHVINLCNLDVDNKTKKFRISSKISALHRLGSLAIVMPLQTCFSVSIAVCE